eukprot:TRINITY_DN78827_c0_g1_i1.p1 TRINITY_DN78827_c0_g1~~TRINITY_DN78827_c0_g1_i1.p1  ORF type:complete len:111 (+),score=6.35 TRINITY_DN78827_c0_g1_i1:78-410(+)
MTANKEPKGHVWQSSSARNPPSFSLELQKIQVWESHPPYEQIPQNTQDVFKPRESDGQTTPHGIPKVSACPPHRMNRFPKIHKMSSNQEKVTVRPPPTEFPKSPHAHPTV